MDCETCQYKERIETLEQSFRDLQKGYHNTDVKLAETTTKLDYLIAASDKNSIDTKKVLNDLQNTINNLAAKPGKRWDTIVNTAITGIVSAIVGAIMALLFLGGM